MSVVAGGEKEKVTKNSNNNDSNKNYNLTKESPQLYYAPTESVEESYSTTRQRVFMHNKN